MPDDFADDEAARAAETAAMRDFAATRSSSRPPRPSPFESVVLRFCFYKAPPLVRGPITACACLALLLLSTGAFLWAFIATSRGSAPRPAAVEERPAVARAAGAALKRPPTTTLNLSTVFILDPGLFLMFNRCKHLLRSPAPPALFRRGRGPAPGSSRSNATLDHNADYYFVKAVTAASFRRRTARTPTGASLFVVPVPCSQSYYGRCGDDRENLRQLRSRLATLLRQPRFSRAANATVVVCDEPRARERAEKALPPGVLFGSAEAWRQPFAPSRTGVAADFVATGLTTHAAAGACPAVNPGGSAARALHVFSSMETSPAKPSFALSRLLWCDAALHPQPGLLLNSHQRSCSGAAAQAEGAALRPLRHCAADAIGASARFVLSLSGNSPITHRIANAIEARALPLVHADEWPAVKANLPFRRAVPWERFVFKVDADEFERAPAKAVADAARAVGNATFEQALRLSERHRRDVLWHLAGSTAHLRFLEEASELARARRGHQRQRAAEGAG